MLVKVSERFAVTSDTHPATDTVHKPTVCHLGICRAVCHKKHKIPEETTSSEYSELAHEVLCCLQ